MLFIEIEKNIVKSLVCSDSEQPALTEIPDDCMIAVGHDVRMYDKDWKLRPLADIVADGIITLADDEKIDGESIVKMTRYDLVKAGKAELSEFEYLDDDAKEVKFGTPDELLSVGRITQKQYDDMLANQMRAKRDGLLRGVDAIAMNPLRFASLTDEQKSELATYRQALLDVPQQSNFPTGIAWPDVPAILK